MTADTDRKTALRLAAFAGLWLVALAVRDLRRGDPDWPRKVAWMAAFSVPTVLLMWVVQRLARYRIPWVIELFAMPIVLGCMVYLAIGIRGALSG